MQFCLQLAPHANIRYRDAQVKLGQAELTCLLCALSLPAETQVTTIGGVPCLTFSANALTPEALALLGTHSTRLMLFECVDDGLLRPLDWERRPLGDFEVQGQNERRVHPYDDELCPCRE